MKNNIEHLRENLEDTVKGSAPIDVYNTNTYELSDCTITQTLDDILMIQYIDVSETGKEVMRNGLYVSLDVTSHVWRVGRVIFAGPNCKTVKAGDHVVFPNDKGIRASVVNELKNIVFLSEARIIATCNINAK